MEFLASQGFDFNKWVHGGVPFMRISDRDRHVPGYTSIIWLACCLTYRCQTWLHAARRLERVDEPIAHNEIAVTKPDDVLFVSQLVEQVTQWLKVCLFC